MKRLLLALLLLAAPAWAVQPSEMLSDPGLEARAREISQGLRCLVCRNENIDDSNAELAHDLRVLVRDRLKAGDTDKQAVDYIVARYGEYVLLDPSAKGANLILWLAGPGMLAAAALIAAVYVRRRRAQPAVRALSDAEKERLAEILHD